MTPDTYREFEGIFKILFPLNEKEDIEALWYDIKLPSVDNWNTQSKKNNERKQWKTLRVSKNMRVPERKRENDKGKS